MTERRVRRELRRGPHEKPDDQQVMTEFKGRQAAEDDEIGPCPDGAFRGGGE